MTSSERVTESRKGMLFCSVQDAAHLPIALDNPHNQHRLPLRPSHPRLLPQKAQLQISPRSPLHRCLSPEGHAALEARGIPKQRIEYLLPKNGGKDYSNDPRFYDCWSKLAPFSLIEYERVVQLDSDMLVLQNMDELMELELDAPEVAGKGQRVFAAGHACVCNPLKKKHYPADWVPENCAFTSQHNTPEVAQTTGPPPIPLLSVS
ncbi:glycosyl transferase family 8 [Botrytis cinerea]